MRGVAVGILAIALFTVYPIPTADACSVHVHDPKNPTYSEDCKNPESWTESGNMYASIGTDGVIQFVNNETGICSEASDVCDAALEASLNKSSSSDGTGTLELGIQIDGAEPVWDDCEHTPPAVEKASISICG